MRVEAVASIVGSESTTVTVKVDIYPAASTVEVLRGDDPVNGKTVSVDAASGPLNLTANIHPLDAMQGVTWTVSDSKKQTFATYEENGDTLTITPKTGVKAGTVTIKVTANDGSKKNATVKLQFGSYAQTVTIDKSVTQITAGDKAIQLSAAVNPSAVTRPGVVWSLKNAADKAYVNLSGSGKISPKAVLAPVEVTVVATSKDGLAKDEHTITVYPKSEGQLVLMDAQGSYVTKTTQTLDINKMSSITLGAYTYGGSEEAVQWSYKLSKNATATEENGRLTIQMTGAGSMGVTAIAADGRKAVVTI